MPAPNGTQVDLNTIQKQIGFLKSFLSRNAMTAAHTLSALLLSEITTLNTAIQAATINTQLPADPTLSLRFEINPDPGIASQNGTQGPTNTTITGTY